MRAATLLVLLFAGAASAVPPTSTPTSSSPPDSTSTPTPGSSPAPPALPVASLLRSAVALEATQRLPLDPANEVVVDPGATFELELSARLPDARLVLVDAREDLVPASSSRELSSGTRITLQPAAPLVPGSRYALRLDGAAERELHGEDGRAFAPLTLPILAAGTPPPPEAKRPVRRKKRR